MPTRRWAHDQSTNGAQRIPHMLHNVFACALLRKQLMAFPHSQAPLKVADRHTAKMKEKNIPKKMSQPARPPGHQERWDQRRPDCGANRRLKIKQRLARSDSKRAEGGTYHLAAAKVRQPLRCCGVLGRTFCVGPSP